MITVVCGSQSDWSFIKETVLDYKYNLSGLVDLEVHIISAHRTP